MDQPVPAPTPLLPIRLLPLAAGIVAALAVLVAAAARGLPTPLDVIGVFLLIGLAAAWIARRTPLRGALFVAALAFIVVAVVYGG